MRYPTRTLLAALALFATTTGCSATTTSDTVTSTAPPDTVNDHESILASIDNAAGGSFECRIEERSTMLEAYGLGDGFAYRTRGNNVAVAYGRDVYIRIYAPDTLSAAAQQAASRGGDTWMHSTVEDPAPALGLSKATACVPVALRIKDVVASSEEPGLSTFSVSVADGAQTGSGSYKITATGGYMQITLGETVITIIAGPWQSGTQPIGVPAASDIPDAADIDAADALVIAPLPGA